MSQEIEVLEPEVVKAQIEQVEKTSGINQDSALALRNEFADYYAGIVEWRKKAEMVTKPDDSTNQKIARDVRLGLRKIRCDVENTRKALKTDILSRGKAIDGFANVLKYLCEPIEEKLMAVEQYAERQEADRIAAIQAERITLIVAEDADPSAYNLGVMDDDTFALVLAGAKKKREDREAEAKRIEAERVVKEQADRLAREKAEKEAAEARAQAEVERKAREAAEAKAKAERVAAEKAKHEAEAKAKDERDAIELKAKKEREAIEEKAKAERAKADAALKAEREAREKLQREANEARQREAQRIADEQAAKQELADLERENAEKSARAPDKSKIKQFASQVRFMIKVECRTVAGKRVAEEVNEKIKLFADWIDAQAETL